MITQLLKQCNHIVYKNERIVNSHVNEEFQELCLKDDSGFEDRGADVDDSFHYYFLSVCVLVSYLHYLY